MGLLSASSNALMLSHTVSDDAMSIMWHHGQVLNGYNNLIVFSSTHRPLVYKVECMEWLFLLLLDKFGALLR